MRRKLSNHETRRREARCLMWAMYSLYDEASDPMALTYAARNAIARVRQLSDFNLRRGKPTRNAPLPTPQAIFARVEEEYPMFDPFLLCCGVWYTDKTGALAPDLIRSPIRPGSTSHSAMAARYGLRRARKPKNHRVRHEVLLKARRPRPAPSKHEPRYRR